MRVSVDKLLRDCEKIPEAKDMVAYVRGDGARVGLKRKYRGVSLNNETKKLKKIQFVSSGIYGKYDYLKTLYVIRKLSMNGYTGGNGNINPELHEFVLSKSSTADTLVYGNSKKDEFSTFIFTPGNGSQIVF